DASFLIHVDGPWGSGKSTLLDFLAGELGKQEDDPWLVVRYDAWRQTRVGPPWWTLLVHLRQTLASRLPLSDRFSLRLAEMRFRIPYRGPPLPARARRRARALRPHRPRPGRGLHHCDQRPGRRSARRRKVLPLGFRAGRPHL